MKTMIRAKLETVNFTFEAIAETQARALAIMQSAWQEHRRQTGAQMSWREVAQDVQYLPMQVNAAYRDGTLIVEKP